MINHWVRIDQANASAKASIPIVREGGIYPGKLTPLLGGTQQTDPRNKLIAQTNIVKVPANQKARREKAKIKEHPQHQENRNGRVRRRILITTHSSITVMVWQTSSQHQKLRSLVPNKEIFGCESKSIENGTLTITKMKEPPVINSSKQELKQLPYMQQLTYTKDYEIKISKEERNITKKE